MQQRHHGLVNNEHREPADDKRRNRTGERVSADHKMHSPPNGWFGERKRSPRVLLLNRVDAASCQSIEVVDGLLRFRTPLVIGVDIGRANDAATVDHKPCRHRQGPTGLAITNREVNAKAEINRL